jgi:hypothetical protein
VISPSYCIIGHLSLLNFAKRLYDSDLTLSSAAQKSWDVSAGWPNAGAYARGEKYQCAYDNLIGVLNENVQLMSNSWQRIQEHSVAAAWSSTGRAGVFALLGSRNRRLARMTDHRGFLIVFAAICFLLMSLAAVTADAASGGPRSAI